MNKEKEIDKLKAVLFNSIEVKGIYAEQDDIDIDASAENLVNAGYGNVKQAVKGFAEKLKKELWKIDGDWQGVDGEELCETIDNLITELYGADE